MPITLARTRNRSTLSRLVRNGKSDQFTIPRPVMRALGWKPAAYIVLELTDDGGLLVRPPTLADLRDDVEPTTQTPLFGAGV